MLELPELPALSLTGNGQQLRETVFAGSLPESLGDGDIRLNLSGMEGDGQVEFVELDPWCNLIVSRCYWKQPGALRYRGEGWIRFNFCLAADATFVFDQHGAYDLKGSELRVFHQPDGIDCGHIIRPEAHSVCVTLSLHRDQMIRRMREIPELAGTVLAGIADDDGFFFERLGQRPEALRAVRDLLDNPYGGSLRARYVRAKSEALLCAAFDAMLERSVEPRAPFMREADWQRIDTARMHIDRDILNVPSVERLARMVGLNRNKLSYGFRHRFNVTISRYVAGERLELAWRLLEAGQLSVSQVADQVGYAHVSSFSAAFKARFGLSPCKIAASMRESLQECGAPNSL